MTQYTKDVEDHQIRMDAIEWAKGVQTIHGHALSSMWYDTRPQDTEGGKAVTDVELNNGTIKRYQNDKLIHTFGNELKGDELAQHYIMMNSK
jgi:hypothetical protein|tara:strand:+ start:482 stop:757 length:276 start_codon:yes stop_codon:yes gene_type:complete